MPIAKTKNQPNPSANCLGKRALVLANSHTASGRIEAWTQAIYQELGELFSESCLYNTNELYRAETIDQGMRDLLAFIASYRPDFIVSVDRAGLYPDIVAACSSPIASWMFHSIETGVCDKHPISPREHLYFATGDSDFEAFRARYQQVAPTHAHRLHWGAAREFLCDNVGERAVDIGFCGYSWSVQPLEETVQQLAAQPEVLSSWLQVLLEAEERPCSQDMLKQRFLAVLPQAEYRAANIDPAVLASYWSGVCGYFLSTRNRLAILSELAEFHMAIFGEPLNDWIKHLLVYDPKLLTRFQYMAIDEPEDLARFYKICAIGLNVQNYFNELHGNITTRVFDTMASGAVLLTPAYTTTVLEGMGLIANEHFVTYRGRADVAAVARHLLDNRDLCKRIGQQGADAIRARHTLRHRLLTMTTQAGLPAEQP